MVNLRSITLGEFFRNSAGSDPVRLASFSSICGSPEQMADFVKPVETQKSWVDRPVLALASRASSENPGSPALAVKDIGSCVIIRPLVCLDRLIDPLALCFESLLR